MRLGRIYPHPLFILSFLIAVMAFCSGCSSFLRPSEITDIPPPKTAAEQQTSYSYIPLDPLPVSTTAGNNCFNPPIYKDLLNSLPDQAVRIAVGQYDTSGALVYGPVKVGMQGKSYQIVLDYISVDAANVPVYISRWTENEKSMPTALSVYNDAITGKSQYRVQRDPESNIYERSISNAEKPEGERVVIPVYLGVGLRLTASITVKRGEANLSSLGAIAASAEAGNLTGSLAVQTLGVTGKAVATALPLPSELNQTTIQNAILALGSIKAVLYDPNTEITPRVVGIYNPVGGGTAGYQRHNISARTRSN